MHFRDTPSVQGATLQPLLSIASVHPVSVTGENILAIYNRLGGVLADLALNAKVSVESALAVWSVESGPYGFEKNRPLLRFEAHKLWQHWGAANAEAFNQHFQFGGNGGVPGSSWSNHKYYDQATGDWQLFHGDQAKEYQAFQLAGTLAGKEFACLSTSFGGPQILGSNHAKLGYASAEELYLAFAQSEIWHVCGFFDFCQSHGLLETLQKGDWHEFAKIYNGPGQADLYAERINDAYRVSLALLQGLPEPLETFDHAAFNAFFQSLDVKNFKAHEFLFKGSLHSTMAHRAYGLNKLPPRKLWPNMAGLAQLLDRIRLRLGAPFILTSIYRSAEYNAAIGGSQQSKHTEFAAIDFNIRNGASPLQWCDALRHLRGEGLFTGCVGLHEGAVHLDLRPENVDF